MGLVHLEVESFLNVQLEGSSIHAVSALLYLAKHALIHGAFCLSAADESKLTLPFDPFLGFYITTLFFNELNNCNISTLLFTQLVFVLHSPVSTN